MSSIKKKPLKRGEVYLKEHTYDGIQEYDQRLPNWWLFTFYGAIIFSVIYWFVRDQTHDMDLAVKDLEAELSRIETIKLAAIDTINDEVLWTMSRNAGFVEKGKETFGVHCAVCHGENLQGGIGLNLVDNEWKWGSNPTDIFGIVLDGSPDKTSGMQAWKSSLGPAKISEVVAYILSHHEQP